MHRTQFSMPQNLETDSKCFGRLRAAGSSTPVWRQCSGLPLLLQWHSKVVARYLGCGVNPDRALQASGRGRGPRQWKKPCWEMPWMWTRSSRPFTPFLRISTPPPPQVFSPPPLYITQVSAMCTAGSLMPPPLFSLVLGNIGECLAKLI